MPLVSRWRLLHDGGCFGVAFAERWRSYCGCMAARSWLSYTPGVHKFEVAGGLHEQKVVVMWWHTLRR